MKQETLYDDLPYEAAEHRRLELYKFMKKETETYSDEPGTGKGIDTGLRESLIDTTTATDET